MEGVIPIVCDATKPYVVNRKAKDAGNLTPIIITSSSLCVDAMTDRDVSNPNLVLENYFK